MTDVGEIVGEGRTSTVRAYGNDSVIKIPKDHVPDSWIGLEASFTNAVRSVGAPAPEVRDVVEVGGRPSVVFERINGTLMWEAIRAEPETCDSHIADLVDLQRGIHELSLPHDVPDLVTRMQSKASAVSALSVSERVDARDLIASLPRGAGVLHGDLHPGNVIIADSGLVAIDWFDVSIGHPLADVLRSTLLMRPLAGETSPVHLPGADKSTLSRLQERYIELFSDVLDTETTSWTAAVAVSRLAEAADPDDNDLWERWRARPELIEQSR